MVCGTAACVQEGSSKEQHRMCARLTPNGNYMPVEPETLKWYSLAKVKLRKIPDLPALSEAKSDESFIVRGMVSLNENPSAFEC